MYIYIICTFDETIGKQNECREGVHNNRRRIKKYRPQIGNCGMNIIMHTYIYPTEAFNHYC